MLYKARVNFFNSNFPLGKKAIVEILIFEDKLEENVDKSPFYFYNFKCGIRVWTIWG
ncbi:MULTISPECIES: hypothetical protein [unclassified Gemella]|uniref:hypothetical protein n=1 Tax=unclassified Gemella TaxID=2624949 RepID=UPI001C055AB0|nr:MULTISPECIES: hypothetical protein [unclassified Gemella]MBU0279074.1 hypothetical protein [Gemella sp. zg-1178]QWQ39120.1 hypothetical protein KMP11_01950 [Gemella sp. zg-570]